MVWPDYFPPNCPPEACEEAVGHIYFFTNNNVALSESFRCHKVRFPEKECSNNCMACGLSVSISEVDAEESRRRVPSLRKKRLMVSVFEDGVGLIKQTPIQGIEKHYTWWCPKDIKCPWDYFVSIDEY